MRRKVNKGVSMVEILISIAIFMILMGPIVGGIISSMNNTTKAKTLQYRNEYVENMVEYVKQDTIAEVVTGDYLSSIGSDSVTTSAKFYIEPGKSTYDASLDEIAQVLKDKSVKVDTEKSGIYSKDATGKIAYYPYETYMISGKVKLGTKHETYSYKMEISNKYYAEKEANTKGAYVNPNNLALGIVEDIDHTKIALINGTIANYDSSVSKAFLTKKLEVLKKLEPDWYETYAQQETGVDMFPRDTATRLITVKVTGSEKTGYKVTCSLKYRDNCEWKPSLKREMDKYYIEYVPFEFNYPVDKNTKVATLPNIYLMYNVCVYNGLFSKDDYVAIDTKGVTDDTKVNFFIVETAESYSDNIINANEDIVEKDAAGDPIRPTLYNNNLTADYVKRKDVAVHLAATTGSKLQNLSVYHNFDIDGKTSDVNKKSSKVYYKASDANLFNDYFSSKNYISLVTYSGGSIDYTKSVANFDFLDKAEQETRGLFDIKVWMEEGNDIDSVDTSKPPVMTATKGGNES